MPLSLWFGAQRQFNTAHLLAHYMGDKALSGDAIAWNRNDPNILSIRLPGGSSCYNHCAWLRCDAWLSGRLYQNAHSYVPCTRLLVGKGEQTPTLSWRL